jgi:hypothetical protein
MLCCWNCASSAIIIESLLDALSDTMAMTCSQVNASEQPYMRAIDTLLAIP